MPAMDVTRRTRWTLGLAALALSAPVAAQTPDLLPAPPAAPDDCTHLENGVQRLACYDALFDAEASMTDADDLASDETASDPEQPEEEENVMGGVPTVLGICTYVQKGVQICMQIAYFFCKFALCKLNPNLITASFVTRDI